MASKKSEIEEIETVGEEQITTAISEEDKLLLDAFHAMKLKNPKVNKEQLLKLMMGEDNTVYEDEHWNPSTISEENDEVKQKHQLASYHFPKLSKFYGDEGKGEVTWPTFKFELES
ncbi:hypothetical protein DPMN_145851 [Dreissena polymorpha]|uniref:Uncharacterized protein n=1 Tax=Dreissena polymorpha TaxID=45954 RepID=A0A9D4F5Z3_DREPO|nr:hypothetical protein DPMN_145851 [Dreissena polymorpha]